MDQHHPHFIHHHHHHHQQQQPQQHRTRYAPLTPQSHHHHNPHHLPPPPPPPSALPLPPPPLSYRTVHTPPPPPTYHNPPPPHQSQQFPLYAHRPIEEERPLPTTNHHLHHTFSSNRSLPDDLLPLRSLPDFDHRRNPKPHWNPSPDNHPQRNYPPLDYDREFNHHYHHRPPPPPPPLSYPPIEKLRYDPEVGSSRLKTECLDENPREGFIWGSKGTGDGCYHRRSILDEPSGPAAPIVDADSESGGYVRVYGVDSDDDVSTRVSRVESRRWVNDRKGPRELHDSPSFELVNDEIGAPMKREYYGSEMVRYNNNCRGNIRECGHEFTRTPPKKQIQKKSALLRIQTVKPNHRNRDVEQLRYAGYAPDSNSNFFRGKEQHGYMGHGMKTEEREGSPMELDISFESNSLVAKAIVAPSSSSAPISDSNLTPVSDSPCKTTDTSSAGKELSLQKNVVNASFQPCAGVTGNPHGKNEVAVSVEVADICSGKSTPRTIKKKKIVKRVVKKTVTNPNSTVSSSLSENLQHGTVQADSVTLSSSTTPGPDKTETCLEEKSTTVDKVYVPEGNVLTEDKKGDLSLLSLGPDCRSQECKTDEDSDIRKVSRFERGGNISNSPSCASSSEDKKSGPDCLDANNSVHDLLCMPNIKMVTNSLNGRTSSEINYMDYNNKQLCQNESSLSLGKYSNIGCPENRNIVDVGDEMNHKLFSSADSVISTDLIDAHNSTDNRVYGFNNNDLTSLKENLIVTGDGNNDTISKAYYENMAPTITQNAILEEKLDTAIPLRSSGIVAFSSSGNTMIQDGLGCLQFVSVLKPGSDNGSSNSEDSIIVHHFDIMKHDNDGSKKVSPLPKRKKVTPSHKNFTQCQSEFSDAILATTSNAEVPISFYDNQAHQKEETALSSMGILSIVQSRPYSEDIAKLYDNILVAGSFESMDANKEAMISEHLELQHSDIVSNSLCEGLVFPNVQFSVLEPEQKENINPIVPVSNTQTDILVVGNIKDEKTDLQAIEENYRSKDFVRRSPRADMEPSDLNMKDDLHTDQNLISCPADGDGVTTGNSNDELIGDSPDALSDMCSQGMTFEVPNKRNLELTTIHDENICGDEEHLNNISVVENGSDLHTSSIQNTKIILKSEHAIGHSNLIMRNIMPEPSQVSSKVTTKGINSYCSELNGSKNQPGGVIHKTFQGHYSFTYSKSKTKTSASSTHISKPRTWHRTGNNPPTSLPRIKPLAGIVSSKRPILERKGNIQNTSYIRKGNSLVRKPTPVSALPQISSANQSPLDLDEIQKSTRSESRADVTNQPIYLRTEANAPQQRQKTPPLLIDTKSEENISSPLVEPPSSGCCENVSDPGKFIETNDAPNSSEDVLKHYETPENQIGPSNNEESQVETNDGNISSLITKRIVYVKPKTNQLVATSNSCDVVSTDDKGQTAFSDGYYKRSKNQLVRTTFESHINQTVAIPNSTVNSDGHGARKVLCNWRFTKRRSHKVAGSSCKPSRASLVWTLRSKNSSENHRDSWHYQKILPHLFPWKRATYLRNFIHNSASSCNSSSLSAISKKLLLLRKRDTVYTRSTHGFSLWKSKVLGVGGSSLKWSKSIERHSKKANEEATLAVAAVERKKREQKDAACIGSRAKRERIFRIGSVRYRMDPSRRTLQRISDDESLSSASPCSSLASKRTYIPRRLMIGNDEYVRIGNGNQLIRDPKKRTRKLANEKVRWSLHTARQRLARKQKYCQFFTRFGKCNKDGRKCPYIHDPSKIAVCTKFLNGLCSTPNCKLTHKVIPERMPDCSYFLQGLCSNRNCPYRHVNVNPKASVCEGFLKGYCADGNECRKKHSYVCPTFEATGTCTQGTKCKLHHPKKQSKGKKRKRSGDQNSRGRYFGSIPVDVSEPGMMMAPRQRQKKDDLENEHSDYISLDVNEDVTDTIDQSLEQSTFCDNDSLDLQLDTSDELIKPVHIITKFTSQSSQSSSLEV